MSLKVSRLTIEVGEKRVVDGVSFSIKPGEIVALMGPNGSGKSSLAYALMGHPNYVVKRGDLILDKKRISRKTPDERARLGLFLAFQYPVGIPGVTVREALLASLRARQQKMSALELKKRVEGEAKNLGLAEELLKRGVNDGFSGGEKKKMEILQLAVLEPKYAILDETDSGLDIDALRVVARGAARMAKEKKTGVLVITHYQRLLKYLKPDRVLVLKKGVIVDEGSAFLVKTLEKEGYKKYE